MRHWGGVMLRSFILIIACLVLSACENTRASKPTAPTISEVSPAIGSEEIFPTNGLKVGRLYFSGKGRRPKFALADGTVFNALCYDDFQLTNELKHIESHVIDEGVAIKKAAISRDIDANLRVSVSKLRLIKGLDVSGNYERKRTYVVENVRHLELTDRGVQVIRDKIGDGCRREIRKLTRLRRRVILVLSALRADKAQYVRKAGGGVKADVSVLPIGGGAKVDYAVEAEYELVFVSINPDDFRL